MHVIRLYFWPNHVNTRRASVDIFEAELFRSGGKGGAVAATAPLTVYKTLPERGGPADNISAIPRKGVNTHCSCPQLFVCLVIDSSSTNPAEVFATNYYAEHLDGLLVGRDPACGNALPSRRVKALLCPGKL